MRSADGLLRLSRLASIFDRRMADRYRRKGPERTTRTLLDLVTCRAGAGGTVLDIGGGTKAGMDQEPLLEVLMDSAAAPKTMADKGGPR